MVYIYAGILYCDDCGEDIRRQITDDGEAPPKPRNGERYDSNEFPKGPYLFGGGEADCPQHCGSGPGCLNATELPSGRKIGVWLKNELTTDGVEYVRKTIRRGGEVAELWAEYYSDCLNPTGD